MIQGFEEQTEPLTDYELNTLVPVLSRALARRLGEQHAISNKDICRAMIEHGYEVNDARVRKVINYIRNNDLVLGLMANSKGYFIAESEERLRKYIDSLVGREEAIRRVRLSMEQHLRKLYHVEAQMKLFND